MSLNAFLNPIKPENKKIVVSNRFVENGKPVEWEIRAITADEDDAIRKTCMTKTKGKQPVQGKDFDNFLYVAKLAAASVVYPDLQNVELQNAYNAMGSEDLIRKMLTFAEYNKLTDFIVEYSGMDKTENELLDEAKN